MKRLIWIGVLMCMALGMRASDVRYVADRTTIFRNPERGFTEEVSRKVSVTNPNVVKGNVNSNWGNKNKMTLAVVLYNFNKFKSEDLPDEVLAGFDEDMQVLRDCGLKCVLRFAYTESENDNVDATPEWVKRHLEQLSEHLKANADVIYVLEAGFVGVWGEWYYTANYGNETQHMNANRRKVVDYLFANAPEDRFILFRYPMIKTEYLDDETPLTSDEAFTGTVKARMGCHNDAFLNNWGNDGTYASDDKSDDPKVRQYIATETLYVPNGGETNVESNSLAEKVYDDAPEEMATYHWSFCGSSYATQVTGRWRSSGLFDTLNVYMGYRFSLQRGIYQDSVAPAGKMYMNLTMTNIGYAPLYNARTAYLVLKSESKSYSLPLETDPRRWVPGKRMDIHEVLTLPEDLEEGTYRLYLHLPDQYSSLAADPRYAVRFANEDIWDEETGMNDLGATVIVSADAPLDPGPLPGAVDEVSSLTDRRVTKRMEEGKLIITLPDGKKYSANGQMIK